MITISVINQSTALPDSVVKAMIPAFIQQWNRDLCVVWGIAPGRFVFVDKGMTPAASSWWCVFLDDSDQAGALAYHDLTNTGLPLSKVFVKTIQADNASVSVAATHELCEMAVDPWLNSASQDQHGVFWASEICLSGDTEIVLANGERPLIGELADRGGFGARKTATRAKTVRVAFSDGLSVQCTPDHLLWTVDGFTKAVDLLPGDVLPGPTLSDAIDCANVYAVPLGEQLRASSRRAGNLRNVLFPELTHTNSLSSEVAISGHSSLPRSVHDIFVMRSEEEMSGVNTCAYIAQMTNFLLFGNGSFVHFERKSMSGSLLPVFGYDLTVSGAGQGSNPNPTAIPLFDTRPKAAFECGGTKIVGSDTYGNAAVSMLSSPMRCAKTFGTDGACATRNRTGRHAKVVDRVEAAGQADVFDLAIPKHHNFAIGAGVFVHNCDPCEDDQYGYDIYGVLVTDFVKPSWFGYSSAVTGPTDFKGHSSLPFSVLNGGYAQYFDPQQGWVQITGAKALQKAKAKNAPIGSRRERRMRGWSNWQLSAAVF